MIKELFSSFGILGTRAGPIGRVIGNSLGQLVDKKLGTGMKRRRKVAGALMP